MYFLNYDTRWRLKVFYCKQNSNKNRKVKTKMKKLTKLVYLLPIVSLTLLFTGCKNENSKIKIGIMQIVEHESLDNARQGFIDELKNLGYEEGKNVDFDVQIAAGETSNCASIAEKFVNDRKDLVLAISTPCAQAMTNATQDIPILVAAVTDFKSIGVVGSEEKPGGNLTGVSDLAPTDKIISLIKKLNPNAKKVGVLYSLTDPSPQYQAEIAKNEIENLGMQCKLASVSQISETTQVTENLAKDVDAVYTPIDKITFATMPKISQILSEKNKFVVCAEDSMISKGAIATYGINYYEIGKMVASQAKKVLSGEEKIGDIPVGHIKDAKLNLNYDLAEKIGIKIPNDLEGDN